MWGNKSWDGAKKKKKREKLERTNDGTTCNFCSKIPENTCTKCGADICSQHTKYYRDNFSSAFKEIFCPDCRKKSLNKRMIMATLTITVIVWISVAQPAFFFTDTTDPLIDHPIDMSYQFGSTNNSITWVCSDLNPLSYQVFYNSTGQGVQEWEGNNIQINVDGFGVGAYNVTLKIFDVSGNWVQDDVNLTVTAV